MKFLKKLFNFFTDKDSWLVTLIETIFWAIFILLGGYIAFAAKIDTTYKTIFLIILAIILYFGSGFIKKIIFRKLGKKDPI